MRLIKSILIRNIVIYSMCNVKIPVYLSVYIIYYCIHIESDVHIFFNLTINRLERCKCRIYIKQLLKFHTRYREE